MARNCEVEESLARLQRGHGHGLERNVVGLAAGDMISGPDTGHDLGPGEAGAGPGQVAVGVAQLKLPGEHVGQGGAGDDAELSGAGHRLGQPPAGDADAHAALDDGGIGRGHG